MYNDKLKELNEIKDDKKKGAKKKWLLFYFIINNIKNNFKFIYFKFCL